MTRTFTRRSVLGAGLLSLTSACIAAPSGGNAGRQGKPSTLEFPSWQAKAAGFGDWHHALASAFEQEHSDLKVELQSFPFDSFVDKLTTRFGSGYPPDIVHLPARVVPQFASQGWLEPLDARLAETKIPELWPPLQDSMKWKGKTYGVLLLGYGYVLYYNAQLLQQAGVGVPKTPEDLVAAAKAVTGGGTYGFGATTAQHPDNYTDLTQFVVGEGAAWMQGGQFKATSPQVVKAMNHYRAAVSNAPQGVQSQQRTELFMNGKIAMMFDGPFLLPVLADASKQVQPHLKVAAPPFDVAPGGASNSLHIAADISEQKKQLVWEYIELAATTKWQRKYTRMVEVPAPRNDSVTQSMREDMAQLALFDRVAGEAVSIFPDEPVLRKNYTELQDTVSRAAIKLITSDTPTADVAASLQDELVKRFGDKL